ncbi:MAG: hypothetical protein VKK04_00225 [Synechococcales bacterium]|nr:hypothetical protein [Synechococcales bacterium]
MVNDWLKGSLDYFVRANNTFLVVGAKNDDLARGFTQLSAELIALDQGSNTEQSILDGAVTTGDIWKFGQLHRAEKRIVQDLNLYRVPADFEDLMRILVAVLV